MPKKNVTTVKSTVKKATVKESLDERFQEPQNPEPQNDSYQYKLSIPKNYTPFYVLLLVVISFLAGALTAKSQYLDKANQANAVLAANNQQQQPSQPSNPPAKVNVANGHFPAMGEDNAKVTMVEFEDARCPFCKQYTLNTFSQIKKDYIDTGKIKVYWRSYAFLGPASITASNGLECANEQGKFWDMHNYLYQNQPDESDTSMYTTDKLTSIAGNLGMDTNQFQTCLSSAKDQKNVDSDTADAQKAGVSGTPTFFINGNTLVGAQPYSAFKTLIDQELAKNQ